MRFAFGYEFNKIVRRNTQETVRNKHSFSVIQATIAFYIAIQLDEYFTNLTIRVPHG